MAEAQQAPPRQPRARVWARPSREVRGRGGAGRGGPGGTSSRPLGSGLERTQQAPPRLAWGARMGGAPREARGAGGVGPGLGLSSGLGLVMLRLGRLVRLGWRPRDGERAGGREGAAPQQEVSRREGAPEASSELGGRGPRLPHKGFRRGEIRHKWPSWPRSGNLQGLASRDLRLSFRVESRGIAVPGWPPGWAALSSAFLESCQQEFGRTAAHVLMHGLGVSHWVR